MTRSQARGAGSGESEGPVRGETLALGALGFAIVALIAISIASVGGPFIASSTDGQEGPVRVVAASGS